MRAEQPRDTSQSNGDAKFGSATIGRQRAAGCTRWRWVTACRPDWSGSSGLARRCKQEPDLRSSERGCGSSWRGEHRRDSGGVCSAPERSHHFFTIASSLHGFWGAPSRASRS